MTDQIILFDIPIHNLTRAEALRRAGEFLHGDRLHHVVTVGPEFLLESTANPEFAAVLRDADLALPEGMGVAVGARLTGQKVRSRYPGYEFVQDVLALAVKQEKTIFFYGADEATVERAVVNALRTYPGLKIVGFESGFRGGHWQQLEDHRVIEKVHFAKPDILMVALGSPKQDLWIHRHREALHHVKLAIGVGRSFQYLAGVIKRPPAVVSKMGLEWAHTFMFANQFHDPRHRRQRVVNATWHFLRTVRRHA